jgi:hypothetical protein
MLVMDVVQMVSPVFVLKHSRGTRTLLMSA